MKNVFVLQMIKEKGDEVKVEIHSVYTTREKADSVAKKLILSKRNGFIGCYISQQKIID